MAGFAPNARAALPLTAATWKVSSGYGSFFGGDSAVTSVASSGIKNAFAVGALCPGTCTPDRLGVLHYNGSKWRTIQQPKGLVTATSSVATAVVATSSVTNTWVFPLVEQATGARTYALRWNGAHWATTKFPASSRIVTAATFGVKNAWAFGVLEPSAAPLNLRYDGTKWRGAHPPGDPQALSAPAANDMWAIGPTIKTATKPIQNQALIAMYWNGSKWRSLALPKVSKPSFDFVVTGGIVAFGPKNVWEFYSLGNPGTCCLFGGMEHWNGVKWHAVSVPYPVQQMTSMAQDGHGGLWMAVRTGAAQPLAFYHLNNGHWSRQYPPSFVNLTPVPTELAWIPGTRDLWSGGFGTEANGTVGIVLGYGIK